MSDVVTYTATRDVPLDELTPFPGNAKRGDVEQIRSSLRRNGQYRSLVVREVDNGPLIVLAGNHTMQALVADGHLTARCEIITCDDAAARRINLVDNRTAELGDYDNDALAELLASLEGDFEGTGYSHADIDSLLDQVETHPVPVANTGAGPDEADVDQHPVDPVTKPGDVWLLGAHRIICGDCRDSGTVEKLLDGQRVNIAFTSPPYASQRTYDESSGFLPIPPDEYVDWFEDIQANVRAHLADDGSWFVNIKASADGLDTYLYVHDLVTAHVRRWGWHYATEFCWERPGMPKSVTRRFKNQFEPVYQFAPGEWKMRPEAVQHPTDNARVPLGAGAGDTRWASDQGNGGVLTRNAVQPGMAYPGNRLPSFIGTHDATGHTAAFPVGLPEWFIKAYSDPGDVVFDPFMGSGSTLIAADHNGRAAYGIEISPAYCDIICRRYQRVTGNMPVLEATGDAHDFASEPANR